MTKNLQRISLSLMGIIGLAIVSLACTPTRSSEASNQGCSGPLPDPIAGSNVTFSHGTASVNGVTLHYVIGGQGEPLVLLHGWPQTWYAWRDIMPTLAQHYTVIAPDLRGLGDSSKPEQGYDTRTVAEDIHKLVEQLGYQQISLVGHDFGGWVAYDYAAAYPDTVRRLALLDITPFDETLLQFTTLSQQGSLWHFNFHYIPDLPEELIAGKEKTYLSWFYRRGAKNPEAISAEVTDVYVRCYTVEGGLHAGFEYYRNAFKNIEQTRQNSAKKLAMPMLVLGAFYRGNSDFFLGQWQNYAENVQGGLMMDSGHYIAEEQPDDLTDRLLQFLGPES